MSQAILLEDRGVVELSGPEAREFLQRLVTNDVAALAPGEARYGALLTPQGKIFCDFLIFAAAAEGAPRFLLDCPIALRDDLVKKLTLYKLRAKLDIRDKSDVFDVLAFLGAPDAETLVCAKDPRAESLGLRALAAKGAVAAAGAVDAYEARRIEAGVPKGGVDFAYGEAFPHDANMDLLDGVDFKKGCYVGQEVVSRMKHRGLARKRIVRYRAAGAAPPPGTPATAGEAPLGVTGSRCGAEGLALIRLDRLEEALAKGERAMAGGVALEFAREAFSGA